LLPALILLIVIIFLFNPGMLPRLGRWLGVRSREPARRAGWIWSSLTGTEEESIRAEQEYGRECARSFATQFSGPVPKEDQEVVAKIGSALSRAAADTRREFQFTVVASTRANAYALPGGFIFITRALLDLCKRNPDEIAFFLGHEVGHVLRGHAKDHLAANALLNAVMSRLSAAGQMLREIIGKGYSRTLELAADQDGVRLAAAAGFDAGASITALQRLTRVGSEPSGLAEYLSSHPPIAERIRELEASLAK